MTNKVKLMITSAQFEINFCEDMYIIQHKKETEVKMV